MPTRFLIVWTLALLIGLAATAGFNAVVDPYGIIGAPRLKGINARKPAAASRSGAVKPYAVARVSPEVLILGNSRPEMGLDPMHPCLRELGTAYSLTLPGTGVYLQVRYAQHAMATSELTHILLGLDFVDFLVRAGVASNPHEWPARPRPGEARLVVDGDGSPTASRWLQRLEDHRNALLSLTALKDSIHTLAAQHQANVTDRTRLGFNPARDYVDIIAHEGQHVLFRQKNREMAQRLNNTDWQLHHDGYRWSTAQESIDRLLQNAARDGVRVIAFINPYHADYLRQIEQAGYADLFRQWKAQMAELVAGRHEVVLWDFAERNVFTTEAPPGAGDTRTVLRWFWEPAHYRRELGDIMLYHMLADTGCDRPTGLPAIGHRLTAPASAAR